MGGCPTITGQGFLSLTRGKHLPATRKVSSPLRPTRQYFDSKYNGDERYTEKRRRPSSDELHNKRHPTIAFWRKLRYEGGGGGTTIFPTGFFRGTRTSDSTTQKI